MSTQQEIIKQFMAALDTTSKTGTAAVDEAINLATNGKFKTAQEVINQMVSDCNSAGGADKFLSDYCGIILDNSDTGAITGKDAGGSAIKTAENIVPESGSLINFTGNSFTVNGLTVQLASMSSSYTLTDLNYSDLTDSAQRYIWQALYSWWVSGALNLIAQSYGDNFSFTSSSSATVKKIYICFTNENNSTTASTTYWRNASSGATSQLAMMINTYYYSNLSSGDVNGIGSYGSGSYGYLDRTLAHEFTHAVMAANVNYLYNLPTLITEGLAELTHGVDDIRATEIRALANNSSSLSSALSLSSSTFYSFAGGYMFLRYLAKQAAEEEAVGVTLNNYTNGVTLTGGAGNDYIYNTGATIKIYAGAGNDTVYNSNGDYSYIELGAGNDSLWGNRNNYVTVDAGAGSDYISISGGSNTVDGGDDDDTIYANGGSINGGAGNDRISLYSDVWSDGTVKGGTGNDTIWLNGATTLGNVYVYQSGDGSDLIHNVTNYDTIYSGESYSTVISGSNVIVSVGSGAMTLVGAFGKSFKLLPLPGSIITNYTKNTTVKGTASADTIENYAGGVYISAGGGNDSIYSSIYERYTINSAWGYVTIDAGAGNDTIYSNDPNVSISGGLGNDSIGLGGTSKQNVTVNAGSGNDTITSSGSKIIYQYSAGDGSDIIYGYTASDTISLASSTTYQTLTSGSDVIISVGSGAMTLVGASSISFKIIGESVPADTIPAGISISGATLTASTKFTGSSIDLADYASTVTKVNASALSRGISIAGTSAANSIKGGSGADTISGGAGNDTVSLGAGNDVYIYSGGNDVIQGYAAGDSISLASGSVSAYSISGSDAVFKIGSNTLKVKSGKGKEIVVDGVVYPTVDSKNVSLTSGADTYTNTVAGATIYALAGNDTISNAGSLFNTSLVNGAVIYGGDGKDSILNEWGDSVKIDGGEGSDTIRNNYGDYVTIYGEEGNDYIINNGDNVTIDAGLGNDTISNGHTSNVKINSGEGADIILNDGSDTTIDAGAGNDWIYVISSSAKIDAGTGADRIEFFISSDFYSNNTISGGTGNDTIWLNRATTIGNVYVYNSGDGNDTIYNVTSYDTVSIGGASYSTTASGNNVIVSVGSGKMTFVNAKDTAFTILPSIKPADIFTTGNDKYANTTANTVLSALAGNDSITNSASNVTIYGEAGNDTIKNSANKVYIDGGAGNDKISLGSSATGNTLIGGAGNDTIYSSGKGNIFLYDAGDGNDSISGSSANDTLKITGGTYTLSGSTVSVYSGDSTVASGKIIFKNTAPQIIGSLKPVPVPEYPKSLTSAANTLTISDDNATVYALAGNDVLKISGNAGYFDGGAGNDKLSLGSSAAGNTLIGGAGNDTIYSSGKGNIFLYEAGDGNDSISGSSANDTLKITGGTYTLSGSTVSVYSGDSTVASGRIIFKNTAPQIIGSLKPESGTETGVVTLTKNSDNHTNTVPGATISALAGADNIKNSANDVSISGEAGNDIISLGAAATNVTINGGAGNDKIYTNGNGNFIEYASGDGNDIIYGFAGEDLIQILSGTPIFAQSNADAIITVGKNSITLKNVDSDELSLDDNNKISLNKIIELTLKYNKNLVELPYERAIIHGSTSNDNYINLGNNVTLDGAAGNDTICNNQNDISISGAAGNDVISLGSSAQNVTIHGGAGADLIYTNGKNNSIQYDAGRDTVHGFGGSDSIQIAGTIKNSQQSGENVVVTVGSSSNILKIVGVNIGDLKYEDGAITYDINEISLTGGDDTKTIDEDKSRVHALGGNDVITNTANEVTIYGGAGKDKITSNGRSTWLDGGEGNDTIRLGEDSEMATITGGAGNDSISVSGGANLFIYEEGDGNDTIVGFSKGDSISVSAERISEPLKNSNVTFEIGAGKIVLRDVADEEFTVENNIIMLKDVSRRQTISGTDKADDPLENDAVGVIIDALGGIDVINNSGGSVTIYGGAGNDKIFNAGNEAYIDGGAGADLISLASGVESATIFGGAGNDTIYSSGNGTLIQYGTGGSKDVIVGFGGSDSIEIVSGTIRNYKADGDDVKVTVGTGTTNVLTLKDFALENFHVEGNLIYSSGRSGSNGLFFDDNFIGGDTQLDSIVEKNFTVTNLDADNFENLAQEKSLITYGEK